MRIRITFRDRQLISYLPVNTNYYLANLLDKMMGKHTAYLKSLIPDRHQNGQKFDLYTFSQLIIPSRRVEHKKIAVYSPEIYWYISSPCHQFISLLAKEFRLRRQVTIAGNSYLVKEFQFLKMPKFTAENEKFTCLSPISLARNDTSPLGGKLTLDNFLLPDNCHFNERLIASIVSKVNCTTNSQKVDLKFSLEFDKKYLERKKNRISKLIAIENSRKRPVYIRAVLAPFRISTTPEILPIIYDTGIGSFTTMGFGMIQKVHSRKL
jgi:CRISPR-associated endoribonuclease Cas6